MSEKTKVLWYSDTPACATGFATVARNLLRILHATGRFEFDVLGINHSDYYDQSVYPYRIYEALPALVQDPNYQDIYGRRRLVEFLQSNKYDIFFSLQDTFILEPIVEPAIQVIRNSLPHLQWIYYYPIDGDPMENWITKSVAYADFPVTYTEYGMAQTLKFCDANSLPTVGNDNDSWQRMERLRKNLSTIYHGTNTHDFFPIKDSAAREKFREEYFKGKAKDKFLVTNINRNQPRKDLARTFKVFAEFKKRVPNAYLYLHAQANDAGGDLREIARSFGLQIIEDWNAPSPRIFQANQGMPVDILNQIYNISDVVITTSLGEGWGLSVTEAMAAKVPVIAPRHTSLVEIIGENEERGLLADAGTTSSEWIVKEQDNGIARPLANVESFVQKLEYCYNNREEMQKKVDAAFAWVNAHTWNSPAIGQKWIEIFDKAATHARELRGVDWSKIERNEGCPCASGKKFKKCHGLYAQSRETVPS